MPFAVDYAFNCVAVRIFGRKETNRQMRTISFNIFLFFSAASSGGRVLTSADCHAKRDVTLSGKQVEIWQPGHQMPIGCPILEAWKEAPVATVPVS